MEVLSIYFDIYRNKKLYLRGVFYIQALTFPIVLACFFTSQFFHILIWRGTQEAQGDPLLRGQPGKTGRGFESLPLRQAFNAKGLRPPVSAALWRSKHNWYCHGLENRSGATLCRFESCLLRQRCRPSMTSIFTYYKLRSCDRLGKEQFSACPYGSVAQGQCTSLVRKRSWVRIPSAPPGLTV